MLHTVPECGYTLRMILMYGDQPCTAIDVDFLNERVKIQNYTDDLLHTAFGVIENPTWEDFQIFLLDRCFPVTRGNLKDLLSELGLQSYDPLQIVEKMEGRTAEDHLWIKFYYYDREGGRACRP